ncbi:MAG: UvrD-helicase domain-containing protein [Rickettsiales bacterium]|nr:UvrD-helicase domain-containing protein [Rickettsiales bacterium]
MNDSYAQITLENMWISASAGSGKTKALTDKFLKILLTGTPPNKILCVTFTRAAAAEMLNRITEELTAWAICNEEELVKKLTNLIGYAPKPIQMITARNCFGKFVENIGEVNIDTIHAFCQKLIEKFPEECGLGLGYQLADEYLIKTVIEEAKISFLNDDPIFSDKSIQYLLTNLSDSKLDILINKVLQIHNLSPKFFSDRSKLTRYVEDVRRDLKLPDNYSQERALDYAINIIKGKMQEDQALTFLVTNALENTMVLSEKDRFVCIKNLFLTQKNTPRISVLKKEQTTDKSRILINEIQKLLLSYLEEESAYKIYKQTFGFLSLGHFFLFHYTKTKNKHMFLDYGDIIQKGLALIKSGGTSNYFLYRLNDRFHHILVDEAQDLNKMQWEFVQTLSNEFVYNSNMEEVKSIFVVGDPKQSIYSFQGSSPLLFEQTKLEVEQLAKNHQIKIATSSLNKSFRSDRIILDFVDQVFKVLRKKNPEYFIEKTNHIANKKFKNSSIEIWPLISIKKDEASKKENYIMKLQTMKKYQDIQSPTKILSQKITTRIKELLQEGYLPSDIMILVRKRCVLMEQIVMSLKTENIPISGVDRLILNKNLAVQDLLSLGRFLLSSYDDYNLACLLKSPIFSISEEELFELCNREKFSLWDNIKRQDKPSYRKIAKFLTDLLEHKSTYTPYQFFSYILDVLKFRTSFLSHFGMHLNEILDEFLNVCFDFESKQSISLSLFIDWFAKTQIEIKRDSYTSANEIRLMTVHAAKGLQAKVVILPDTTSTPQSNSKQDGVLFNAATRKLLAYQGATNHSLCKNFLDKAELQTLQEYYRLLYVALTRAAEKLIICGWSNSENVSSKSWYFLLQETAQINKTMLLQKAHC